MVAPHVTPCGHTFCASCIFSWLKRNPVCPTCRCPSTNAFPSRALDELLRDVVEPNLSAEEVGDSDQRRREWEACRLEREAQKARSATAAARAPAGAAGAGAGVDAGAATFQQLVRRLQRQAGPGGTVELTFIGPSALPLPARPGGITAEEAQRMQAMARDLINSVVERSVLHARANVPPPAPPAPPPPPQAAQADQLVGGSRVTVRTRSAMRSATRGGEMTSSSAAGRQGARRQAGSRSRGAAGNTVEPAPNSGAGADAGVEAGAGANAGAGAGAVDE